MKKFFVAGLAPERKLMDLPYKGLGRSVRFPVQQEVEVPHGLMAWSLRDIRSLGLLAQQPGQAGVLGRMSQCLCSLPMTSCGPDTIF
jgi:hypothetical protein